MILRFLIPAKALACLFVFLWSAIYSHCAETTLDPYLNAIRVPGPSSCADPASPSGFVAGRGLAEYPYLICNYEQFNLIRNNMSAYYVLAQDIDASLSWSEGSAGCMPYDGTNVAVTDPCGGFEGFSGDFTGGLDGRGHVIRNLYSYRLPTASSFMGSTYSATIFGGEIRANAYIRNLGIVDIRYRAGNNTAILGTINRGLIHNVYLANSNFDRGSIRDTGLLGVNHNLMFGGHVGATAVISNSFTAIDIGYNVGGTGEGNAASAFVGSIEDANITNCYTRGDLTVFPGVASVGPILGLGAAAGRVENVYATSDIATGVIWSGVAAGGLIGVKNELCEVDGTNYFVASFGGANGISDNSAPVVAGMVADTCVSTATCMQLTLANLRSLATLPADWNADDWDLRGPSQVPALKYGGGPDICGELCGQTIPNQSD